MNNLHKAAATAMLAAVLWMLPGFSRAQDGTEKPEPPYVAAVPDIFAWTITVDDKSNPIRQTGDQESPSSAGNGYKPVVVEKIVCTKTKDIKRDDIFFSNGKCYEVWYIGNIVVTKSANGGFTIGGPAPDVSVKGFFGVDWLTAGSFQNRKKLKDGTEVYVYSGVANQSLRIPTARSMSGPTSPLQSIQVPSEAMIDVKTRLPITVRRDSRTFSYSYQPAPAQMLEIPEEFQKELAPFMKASSTADVKAPAQP